MIGIVGRGWGKVYGKALERLGIEHWIAGRDWEGKAADGVIVACSSEAHYEVAHKLLSRGVPVLVEKPVSLCVRDAEELVSLGGIGFAGHTRLFDPAWAEFKERAEGARLVTAFAGGVTDSQPDPDWNWLPHLVAMCLDLGCDPYKASFRVTEKREPLRFIANGHRFVDTHNAVDHLVRTFLAAIDLDEPNNDGLKLGLETVRFVERKKCHSLITPR